MIMEGDLKDTQGPSSLQKTRPINDFYHPYLDHKILAVHSSFGWVSLDLIVQFNWIEPNFSGHVQS